MLWLVNGDSSYEVTACNIHSNEKIGFYELWVERSSGKTVKIESSYDISTIQTIKDAIDYAIEHDEKVLRLA